MIQQFTFFSKEMLCALLFFFLVYVPGQVETGNIVSSSSSSSSLVSESSQISNTADIVVLEGTIVTGLEHMKGGNVIHLKKKENQKVIPATTSSSDNTKKNEKNEEHKVVSKNLKNHPKPITYLKLRNSSEDASFRSVFILFKHATFSHMPSVKQAIVYLMAFIILALFLILIERIICYTAQEVLSHFFRVPFCRPPPVII